MTPGTGVGPITITGFGVVTGTGATGAIGVGKGGVLSKICDGSRDSLKKVRLPVVASFGKNREPL